MGYSVSFLKQYGGRVYNDEYIRGKGRSRSQGMVEDGGSRLLQAKRAGNAEMQQPISSRLHFSHA